MHAEGNAEAVLKQNLPSPIPRGKTKAKKTLKEVQMSEAPQSKKPRKRAPKRSPIYYYEEENDGACSESERKSRCLDHPRLTSSIPGGDDYHSPSTAVNCNAKPHCSTRQQEQSRCRENSREFEFQNSTAHEIPREDNRPGITDDKENQINEGLDNVKILEYHSISSNMEVVYPDVPKTPGQVTEGKFHPVQSTATAPVLQAPHIEASQRSPTNQAPAPTQPVIHYVPVFAVQGPNGVYYEPVPGAPHVVQNGRPAQYPSPQPGHPPAVHPQAGHPPAVQPQPGHPPAVHPQAGHPPAVHPQAGHPQAVHPQAGHPQAVHPQAGHPPAVHPQAGHPQTGNPQAVHPQAGHPPAVHPQAGHPPAVHPQAGHPPAVPRVPEQAVPQQPSPQQFAPRQMRPVQPHPVAQQVPQPQPMQPSPESHRQQLPPQQQQQHQQQGGLPYPVPQPYSPPSYPQQPQAMSYSAESPPYAKPVQGMQYPPSTQVAMATKPYPVTAQAPAPVPQHYAAQSHSGHAVMQYGQYPPASQGGAAVPQGYQPREHPPASQGQVMQHYPHAMTNQRQPAPQPTVTPQPYQAQRPQEGTQPSPVYQQPVQHYLHRSQAGAPFPTDKTSPVPTTSYAAASRPAPHYVQPANQPYTSQASYYPPTTVPSQQSPPAARPVAARPAQGLPREEEPKFVYAPLPVNFHQSPVYRVPEQSKAGAVPTSMPSANPGQDKTSGSRRRKATMPHRGTRDIPSSPESYNQQASPQGRSGKGDCHSPLNKSSCIITPPGSPPEKDQNNNGETYTVVVHDRGIQTRPQEMEPRWCPTKRLWKMEPKHHPHPAPRQQAPVERVAAVKVEAPSSDEESLSSPEFSPTQKENMYIPDENSVNTQRPHGMRRGKGRRSSGRYHCKFCSKGFQWHSHLLSHERTHTGERPYQCTKCSRAFTRADGLQCHMIVHNKKKPFKCQYCAKGFSDNTLLEKHVYSHTGVKPFKCEYCGREFTDSHSIEKHLLVHTGTKPFKCQYCVRSFNDSQMLVRHIRSHTGEKPYKCHHCPMAFSKQSALVIHTRVHTGEKPYKCPNCPKSFSISGNLQRHILIHTGERPYKCSKCPKAFNNPSHLSRHISKLHAPKVHEKNCVSVPVEANTIQVEMAHWTDCCSV